MTGYIKLHRKICKWQWYGNVNMTMLYIHLLLNANYQDNLWQGITIKKGSLATSLDSLSKETGLSIQNVRTCLEKLRKSKEISMKTTNKYRVITILSYDSFQSDNKQITDNQQATNKQVTSNQQTNNNQLTTIKEREEVKKVIEKDNLSVIQKEKTPSRATSFKALRDENDNAVIPNEYYQYALTQNLQTEEIHHEFNKFANHYESASGQNSRKKNWYRTWQNWIANAYSFSCGANNRRNSSTVTAINKVSARLNQYNANTIGRPESAFKDL